MLLGDALWEEAYQRGRLAGQLRVVWALMLTQGWSAVQTMYILDIPAYKHAVFIRLLQDTGFIRENEMIFRR